MAQIPLENFVAEKSCNRFHLESLLRWLASTWSRRPVLVVDASVAMWLQFGFPWLRRRPAFLVLVPCLSPFRQTSLLINGSCLQLPRWALLEAFGAFCRDGAADSKFFCQTFVGPGRAG